MHKRLAVIIDWLKEHHRPVIITSLCLVLAIVVALIIATFRGSIEQVDRTGSDGQGSEQESVIKFEPSPLTGLDVDPAIAKKPVMGIMVSNSHEARPQSGLVDAGVVFEAIAEGGITRYLALFLDKNPKFVGPVRSLRPYYIDWARGFNAYVAHVGGSPKALSLAKTELGSRDLDQFAIGTRAFERVDFRFAPHNVYTGIDKLLKLGEGTSDFTSLTRKDPQAATTADATSIVVNFSTAGYNTAWKYDATSNRYLRKLEGKDHNDRETKKQLVFDVVVVIKSEHGTIREGGSSYNDITTTGKGKALIFQDGTVVEVTWRKSSATSQYKFTNKDNDEIALSKGQVWFAIQPTNQSLRYE